MERSCSSQNLIPFLALLIAFFISIQEVSMQDSTTSSSNRTNPGATNAAQNISSADNSTGNPDDDNFRARRPRLTTTTEDPLLDATLDPRLETDAFNLVNIMMLNDFLGSSVLAGLEMHQMSRMANIPLPYERIGPAPPLPPVPSGPVPAPSPAAPSLLPLYLNMLNNQARPQYYGYHSSEGRPGAGSYSGGESNGDDPVGSNCDMNEAKFGICSDPSDLVSLVPLQDYLLAKGKSGIYRIAYNGTPLGEETEMFGFEKRFPTATFMTPARMYLFFGYKYTATHPVTISPNKTTKDDIMLARKAAMFRTTKLPLKGIIQSSDGLIIFFSEKSFVMHSRNGSSYGEDIFRPLSEISGAPERIDSAFTIDSNNSSFVYRRGWLYQLQLPDLKITKKVPFRSDNPENTWLKCTEMICS